MYRCYSVPMSLSLKGPLFVFISAILYGSYGVWAVLLGDGFGNFFQAYARSIVVLAALIPVCIYTGSWVQMHWSDIQHFKWVLIFLPFSQVPIYYAFQHAGVGITTLIFFGTYAVTAYVVAYLLVGEKMNVIKLVSLLLALVGLYLTFVSSLGAFSFLALLMAVVAGISGGGGMSALKLVPKRFSALQILVLTWGLSLVVHIPLSLYFGEQPPKFDVHWLALIGFAAAGFFASWFVVEGLRHMDASLAGLIGLLEVIAAIILGYFIFSEELHVLTLLGGLIILIAAALPHMADVAKKRFA